jgi:murein DD-endopeptidase MepM/ murein hydrolase activator NlpD
MRIDSLMKMAIIATVALTAAACSSLPSEPRYSIYANPTDAPTRPVGVTPGVIDGVAQPRPTDPATEAAPPATAPYEAIEGGSLPPPANAQPPVDAYNPPLPVDRDAPPPAGSAAAMATPAGAASVGAMGYVIQQGDTISGVGRRFGTPVQTLIDLNDLGPRAAIAPGQRIALPASAVDRGVDPFATGPSPTGVTASNEGLPPPPPPPPSGNQALPLRPATETVPSSVTLDWPVRGDILRRFGPTGMGSRNNGVNIGAGGGEAVRTSAPGRVAYVGNTLPGQGLTVLVVHRDGWRTTYGHLGQATVNEGDEVRAGQQIGTVGTTAGDGRPSIHFEIWRMRGDEPVAIDPLTQLPR